MFVFDQSDLPIARDISVLAGDLAFLMQHGAQGADDAGFPSDADLNATFGPVERAQEFLLLLRRGGRMRMDQPMDVDTRRCINGLLVVDFRDFENSDPLGIARHGFQRCGSHWNCRGVRRYEVPIRREVCDLWCARAHKAKEIARFGVCCPARRGASPIRWPRSGRRRRCWNTLVNPTQQSI